MFSRLVARLKNTLLFLTLIGTVISTLIHGPVPGQAAPAKSEPVSVSVELDHPVIPAGETRAIYLLLEFQVPEVKPDPAKPRPQINLGLVIDRSGSMADKGKMTYALAAAKMVVDRLGRSDYLSVVEYDDRITVLWPSSPVESPDMVKRLIDRLRPRGSTNLTGGMLQGAEEILKNAKPERINRVLLLSDGLANTGITHPVEILRLVRETKSKGVQITTLGLGLHFNENLMQAIAEHGGGHYYYVENPAQMARIFQEELTALFTTVAKDVILTFTSSAAVSQVGVFGYPFKTEGRETKVVLADFFQGEKRSLLLRLEVTPQPQGQVGLGEIHLAFRNTEDGQPGRIARPVAVTAATSPEQVVAAVNKRVQAESTLIEAEQAQAEAVKLYEKGQRDQAKQSIAKLSAELKQKNVNLGDQKIAKKIEALELEREQMDLAAQAPAATAAYLKMSKQQVYQAQQGKRGLYLLQEGDKGLEVEELQKALKGKGLYAGEVNGRFGPELAEAVRKFQGQNNLKADGAAGPKTLKALGLYY